MKVTRTSLVRALFGGAVTVALGFGATQAFATPKPAATAPLCTAQQCTLSCLQRGYAGGVCNPQAMCVCVGG